MPMKTRRHKGRTAMRSRRLIAMHGSNIISHHPSL
jgi:hypothetical protein